MIIILLLLSFLAGALVSGVIVRLVTRNKADALLAEANARLEIAKERIENQKTESEELRKQFNIEFENIANRIFEEKSRKFSQVNEEKISTILNPLKEKIQHFEKKVEDTYNNETREKASLREQLKQIIDINRQMSDDAQRLTSALKGDKKMQGNWGEMQLEQLLEKSGLENGVHYNKQVSLQGNDRQREIPDFVINLPDNKHYIIDSKVSLVNYEMFYNTDDEEQKLKYLQAHTKSIENHINALGNKQYQNLLNTPDFVFMYFAVEPALYAALQNDNSLFEKAFQKNIVLVSTTTLLASLRTVSFIWRQENQRNNVLEIARLGGQLYDKFVGFTENLISVGKSMDKAKETYADAMNQLVKENANGQYNAGTIVGMT
ncbi:MAG: DNA recombination protein RmuC, partial [Dysgonamonadaceae bacterium]|nr:DNA recombination protein RmuC [Dysgonamonadaceae bacterium]